MPTPSVSAQEQLMMELTNRARLDPLGEAARFGISLNEGLAAGTISSRSKAPLAFDMDLNEASAKHSGWMLGSDIFSHTGLAGSTPGDRMKVAGYSFSGTWKWGENIAWTGTTGTLNTTQAIYEHHKGLFLSAGHRVNTLGDFRELGIAQEMGGFTKSGTAFNSSMVTQNFAKTGAAAFVTGVAYTDRDGDRFYDVGEGKSGIVIDWLGNSGSAVSTATAGGYGVSIPTGLAGAATVAVDVGSVTVRASLAMTGTNVKLDVINGRILAASTDLTLGAYAQDGLLLGVANTDLTGNGGANVLTGNRGANSLSGLEGNDRISGGHGADKIWGGTGSDRLDGGAGADILYASTGADTLNGGADKDHLYGGTDGSGDDFVFTSRSHSRVGTSRDTIHNFNRGSDNVDLRAIDARPASEVDSAFAWGGRTAGAHKVWWTATDGGILLRADVTGNTTADFEVFLKGVTSLGEGDVLL